MTLIQNGRLADLMVNAVKEGRILTLDGAMTMFDIESEMNAFRKCGIRPREAVGMCFDNGPKCIATYIALVCLEAVPVPQAPGVPEKLRAELWTGLGCRYAAEKNGITRLSSGTNSPPWPEDVLFVVHSSGSEGIPKAIPLTANALWRNAEDVVAMLGIDRDILHLGSMSQCYTNGLYNSFVLPLMTGGRVLVGPVASALNMRLYVRTIREGRPGLVWINPTALTLLRRSCLPSDVSSVKLFVSCTAPLSQEDCIESETAFQKPVLQSYGLSETLIVSIELPNRNARNEFSVGMAVGGPESVSVGPDGALMVQNGAVMPGYATVENSKIMFRSPNGVPGTSFAAGDVARVDSAGRLFVMGRRSGAINVSGAKVGMEQIENVLLGFPAVVGAAVAAVADRQGQERPAAVVQTKGPVNLDELADKCAELLGPHARPVSIRLVPEIPTTANGKIDRRASAALISTVSARTPIIGLSHIFGETKNMWKEIDFWIQAGMRLDFSCRLPVPAEKRHDLLLDPTCEFVELSYLSFKDSSVKGPGIEMISHHPSSDPGRASPFSHPAVRLVLPDSKSDHITDPDGNQLGFDKDLTHLPTVILATPDTAAAGQVLSLLGFQRTTDAGMANTWSFRLSLFPNLATCVRFVEDKSRPRQPKVDNLGWSGLSFLTPDISRVAGMLPLRGHQNFQTDDKNKKEIAFYSGAGLLLEFLMITRQA